MRGCITWFLTYIVCKLLNHVIITNFAFAQTDFRVPPLEALDGIRLTGRQNIARFFNLSIFHGDFMIGNVTLFVTWTIRAMLSILKALIYKARST